MITIEAAKTLDQTVVLGFLLENGLPNDYFHATNLREEGILTCPQHLQPLFRKISEVSGVHRGCVIFRGQSFLVLIDSDQADFAGETISHLIVRCTGCAGVYSRIAD